MPVCILEAVCQNNHKIAMKAMQVDQGVLQINSSRQALAMMFMADIESIIDGSSIQLPDGIALEPYCPRCQSPKDRWIVKMEITQFSEIEQIIPLFTSPEQHMTDNLNRMRKAAYN